MASRIHKTSKAAARHADAQRQHKVPPKVQKTNNAAKSAISTDVRIPSPSEALPEVISHSPPRSPTVEKIVEQASVLSGAPSSSSSSSLDPSEAVFSQASTSQSATIPPIPEKLTGELKLQDGDCFAPAINEFTQSLKQYEIRLNTYLHLTSLIRDKLHGFYTSSTMPQDGEITSQPLSLDTLYEENLSPEKIVDVSYQRWVEIYKTLHQAYEEELKSMRSISGHTTALLSQATRTAVSALDTQSILMQLGIGEGRYAEAKSAHEEAVARLLALHTSLKTTWDQVYRRLNEAYVDLNQIMLTHAQSFMVTKFFNVRADETVIAPTAL